jgi:hypothetical protein
MVLPCFPLPCLPSQQRNLQVTLIILPLCFRSKHSNRLRRVEIGHRGLDLNEAVVRGIATETEHKDEEGTFVGVKLNLRGFDPFVQQLNLGQEVLDRIAFDP